MFRSRQSKSMVVGRRPPPSVCLYGESASDAARERGDFVQHFGRMSVTCLNMIPACDLQASPACLPCCSRPTIAHSSCLKPGLQALLFANMRNGWPMHVFLRIALDQLHSLRGSTVADVSATLGNPWGDPHESCVERRIGSSRVHKSVHSSVSACTCPGLDAIVVVCRPSFLKVARSSNASFTKTHTIAS